jgi:nucleoside-diphosphate-sugar epimerase
MLMKEKVRSINVGGTQTLLNGCASQGVLGLVYTSSANVVFSGKYEMPDLAEDLPYNLEQDCVDEYSKTKCIAEQLVINYNGRPLKLKNSHHPEYDTIATCAVRPAAIYGEGEERHFPRIIEVLESGMLKFLVGSPDSLVDWVHVDNLVYGHILAAAKLLSANPSQRQLVGGKAYYISDKKPMNNWIFMKPFIEGLGFKFPSIWIPFKVMFKFAHALEIIHSIISPIFPFQPFANRAEVCKIGVTHYFRTDKAERELGWSLVVSPEEGMNRMVKYFQEKQAQKKKTRTKEGNSLFVFFIIAFLALAIVWQYFQRVK